MCVMFPVAGVDKNDLNVFSNFSNKKWCKTNVVLWKTKRVISKYRKKESECER